MDVNRVGLAILVIAVALALIYVSLNMPSPSVQTVTTTTSGPGVVNPTGPNAPTSTTLKVPITRTFNVSNESICTEKGKPVIRLFSTQWCPHCVWMKDTFDAVALEYVNSGKIVAHHWQLDNYDDTLTPAYDGSIPPSEIEYYRKFNPESKVPMFVFGCRYYRVGNGYESTLDLAAEEREFRDVIDELVNATE